MFQKCLIGLNYKTLFFESSSYLNNLIRYSYWRVKKILYFRENLFNQTYDRDKT